MIHPTPETYALLPDLVKPTLVQLFVPHVHALNFLPLYVSPSFSPGTKQQTQH